MTREDAKREMMFAKRNVVADSWIDQAYDLAIQALSQPERKQGEWEVEEQNEDWKTFDTCRCSECGAIEYFNKGWKKFSYCPSCGADLRGKEE